MSKKKSQNNDIVVNRKASHDYFIEETFEAGLALEGWEVKALRAGKVHIKESHILIKSGEIFLFGATITPLSFTSTHKPIDPTRTRKLLLHRREINQLVGAQQRDGYTLVPLNMYWHGRHIKMKMAIAKGKKEFDKRDSTKNREWAINKQRLMKNKNLKGF